MAKTEKKVEPVINDAGTTARAIPHIQPITYQHGDGRVYLVDKKMGNRKTLMHLKPAESMVRSNPSRYSIQP